MNTDFRMGLFLMASILIVTGITTISSGKPVFHAQLLIYFSNEWGQDGLQQ